MNSIKNFSNLAYKVDFFGKPIQLRYKDDKVYRSFVGTVFSFIIIITVVSVVSSEISHLIYRTQSTTELQQTLADFESELLDRKDFEFAVAINQNLLSFYQNRYENFQIILRQYEQYASNIFNYTDHQFTEKCNDYDKISEKLNIQVFCLDPELNLYLNTYQHNNYEKEKKKSEKFFEIKIIYSKENTDVSFTDLNLGSNQNLQQNMFFLYQNGYINPDNYKTPFVSELKLIKINVSPYDTIEVEIQFQQNEIISQIGWFFSEEKSEQHLIYEQKTYMYKQKVESTPELLSIYPTIKQKKMIYKRSYTDVYSFLSSVGGLISSLIFIGRNITKPFVKYSFQASLLNDLFEFETLKESKEETKNMPQNKDKKQQEKNKFYQASKKVGLKLKRNDISSLQDMENHILKIFSYFLRHVNSFKITLKDYFDAFNPFIDNHRKQQFTQCQTSIYQKMDLVYILKKLQEIDKLKQIMLDQDQRHLFEFWPKQLVKLDVHAQMEKYKRHIPLKDEFNFSNLQCSLLSNQLKSTEQFNLSQQAFHRIQERIIENLKRRSQLPESYWYQKTPDFHKLKNNLEYKVAVSKKDIKFEGKNNPEKQFKNIANDQEIYSKKSTQQEQSLENKNSIKYLKQSQKIKQNLSSIQVNESRQNLLNLEDTNTPHNDYNIKDSLITSPPKCSLIKKNSKTQNNSTVQFKEQINFQQQQNPLSQNSNQNNQNMNQNQIQNQNSNQILNQNKNSNQIQKQIQSQTQIDNQINKQFNNQIQNQNKSQILKEKQSDSSSFSQKIKTKNSQSEKTETTISDPAKLLSNTDKLETQKNMLLSQQQRQFPTFKQILNQDSQSTNNNLNNNDLINNNVNNNNLNEGLAVDKQNFDNSRKFFHFSSNNQLNNKEFFAEQQQNHAISEKQHESQSFSKSINSFVKDKSQQVNQEDSANFINFIQKEYSYPAVRKHSQKLNTYFKNLQESDTNSISSENDSDRENDILLQEILDLDTWTTKEKIDWKLYFALGSKIISYFGCMQDRKLVEDNGQIYITKIHYSNESYDIYKSENDINQINQNNWLYKMDIHKKIGVPKGGQIDPMRRSNLTQNQFEEQDNKVLEEFSYLYYKTVTTNEQVKAIIKSLRGIDQNQIQPSQRYPSPSLPRFSPLQANLEKLIQKSNLNLDSQIPSNLQQQIYQQQFPQNYVENNKQSYFYQLNQKNNQNLLVKQISQLPPDTDTNISQDSYENIGSNVSIPQETKQNAQKSNRQNIPQILKQDLTQKAHAKKKFTNFNQIQNASDQKLNATLFKYNKKPDLNLKLKLKTDFEDLEEMAKNHENLILNQKQNLNLFQNNDSNINTNNQKKEENINDSINSNYQYNDENQYNQRYSSYSCKTNENNKVQCQQQERLEIDIDIQNQNQNEEN